MKHRPTVQLMHIMYVQNGDQIARWFCVCSVFVTVPWPMKTRVGGYEKTTVIKVLQRTKKDYLSLSRARVFSRDFNYR